MVKEDFPLPDTPVTTINLFLGNETVTFFKLCVLAPHTSISSAALAALSDAAFADFFTRCHKIHKLNRLLQL
jgi:hypothetical protein